MESLILAVEQDVDLSFLRILFSIQFDVLLPAWLEHWFSNHETENHTYYL